MLDNYIKWIVAHERLLLVAVIGLVIWFGIGKIDTLISNHDNANLQQAKVAAAVQAEKNQETAAVVAQQAIDMKVLSDKVQAQNTALEQANLALVAALSKQQKIDATMTDPQLASRWNTLVPDATVTTTSSGVSLSSTGAHATVNELEKIPVLTQELSASQQESKNDLSLLTSSSAQVVTLNTLVAGKDASLKAADNVCKEQIKVVKDEARTELHKAKRNWFIGGVVTTLVTLAKFGVL